MKEKRIVYVDYIKAFAMIAVIMIHTSGEWWYKISVLSFDWKIINLVDSLARMGVPLFVMASGVLFLNPERELKINVILKKYCKRIVLAFAFWSVFYVLKDCITQIIKTGDLKTILNINTLKNLLGLDGHLWFCYMIVGLYLISPIISRIIIDKRLVEYFLSMWLISTIICYVGENTILYNMLQESQLVFFSGYIGYFVLGYYLHTYPINIKLRRGLYIIGVISAMSTILIGDYLSVKSGEPFGVFSNMYPNIIFYSIAIFLFIQQIKKDSSILYKGIVFLSKNSLGIYFLHPFIIECLNKIKITIGVLPAAVYLPVCGILTLIITSIGIKILKKIPILQKIC